MSAEGIFFKSRTALKQNNVFIDMLQSIAIAIGLSIFLYVFILIPNEVDGPSMEPNFVTGDLLFTSKLHSLFNGTEVGNTLNLNYTRGDVVVFQKPGLSDFVKRIIGLPGDSIKLENGIYYINDNKLEEYYNLNNDQKKDGTFLEDGERGYTLKEDEYFLSGDNRNVSYDSRSIGPIKEGWLKGKVIFRFWPLNKFGVVLSGKSNII